MCKHRPTHDAIRTRKPRRVYSIPPTKMLGVCDICLTKYTQVSTRRHAHTHMPCTKQPKAKHKPAHTSHLRTARTTYTKPTHISSTHATHARTPYNMFEKHTRKKCKPHIYIHVYATLKQHTIQRTRIYQHKSRTHSGYHEKENTHKISQDNRCRTQPVVCVACVCVRVRMCECDMKVDSRCRPRTTQTSHAHSHAHTVGYTHSLYGCPHQPLVQLDNDVFFFNVMYTHMCCPKRLHVCCADLLISFVIVCDACACMCMCGCDITVNFLRADPHQHRHHAHHHAHTVGYFLSLCVCVAALTSTDGTAE